MHSVQNCQRQKRLSREQKEQQPQKQRKQQRQRPPRLQLLQISGKQQSKQQQSKEDEQRKECRPGAGGDISFKGVDLKTAIFHNTFIANLSLVLLQTEYIEHFNVEKSIGGGGVYDSDFFIDTDTGKKSLSDTTPQPPPPPNIKAISIPIPITISILLPFDKLGEIKVFRDALVVSSIQSTYNSNYSG